MEETWIEEQRHQLKEMYTQCNGENGQEPVLEAFSIYLLRILNGLSQMESSKLYGYESQILGEAMRLFCKHYKLQVKSALDAKISLEDKKAIICDIEDAISKISNVYKNVIDSTANSDRQMFTSQAVETSIYDISPKLFATYSVILETLVHLFGKQEVYAFLLHPSLKSNIEAVGLFNMRETEGKVVLIYIPENEIERVTQIPIYLLHEAFHVLTKEERNRKDRAFCMEHHVHNAISQRIFREVNFNFLVEENADEITKSKLMERWFNIEKRMEELKEISSDDRRLYSKNIVGQICENYRDWLCKAFQKLGDDLCQVLDSAECRPGENPYAELISLEWKIQRNIVEILASNLVERYVWIYLTVYREAYADIACVLATGISPEQYEQAFKDSDIAGDVSAKDIIRALRIHMVAKSIASCDKIENAQEWKAFSEKNDFCKRKQNGSQKGRSDEQSHCNDVIDILAMDLELFERVLKGCADKLWNQLGEKNSKFEQFRNIIKQIELVEILNGKVNEQLRALW